MDIGNTDSTPENSSTNASGQAAEQQAWIDRSLSNSAGGAVVIEALGIGQVKDLYTEFQTRMQQPDAINLDLSKTEMFDAAGLQLLVAFHQEAMKRGQQVNIIGAREALGQSLSLLGLQLEIAIN